MSSLGLRLLAIGLFLFPLNKPHSLTKLEPKAVIQVESPKFSSHWDVGVKQAHENTKVKGEKKKKRYKELLLVEV